MEDNLNKKLYALSQISKVKLKQILDSVKGQKNLVIDEKLIKPLDRICDMNWLRQQGIEKVFKFNSSEPHHNLKTIYFIPSNLITLKLVLDQIHSYSRTENSICENILKKLTLNSYFHIIIFPKVLQTFKTLLEEEGLYGIVTLHSFQWELIQLDDNILSLEYPGLFKNLYIKQDSCLLSSISNSLWTLCQSMGKPGLVLGLGQNSNKVLNMFNTYCDYYDVNKKSAEFGAFLVMDRDQDYTSTLLIPATYSGLLNEVFNIKCGTVQVNKIVNKITRGKLKFDAETDEGKDNTLLHLNSNTDTIYSDIKFKHFSVIFSQLCGQAKALNMQKANAKTFNINEMKQFVESKLQEVSAKKRDLANHLLACETIIQQFGGMFELIQTCETCMLVQTNRKQALSTIQELMSTETHKQTVVKMLCLYSLTLGLSFDDYTALGTKFFHAFGFDHLHIFQNLTTAGLFLQPSNKFSITIPNLTTISASFPNTSFHANANKLKQLPSETEVNVKDPIVQVTYSAACTYP
ncbi:vacuolar protein sorting-associated protein 33B [Ctenocephalides felis]|uniref:vacuolar protein sorting-associated protein 33B n=1 Tax=Ctenocephalides felis TaxID=7515 RepID=UPI000E6E1798|nr:vacuolar protein sorting-associated protein 33B [Ctenocephalides felis]